MEEKILQGKKNGMLVLVITTLLYIAAGVGLVFGILADSMVFAGCCDRVAGNRLDSMAWSQSAEAAGSTCADAVRQILRNTKR